MIKLAIFVGTRPEIIKMAEVIRQARTKFEMCFVHTGQHYDWEMSAGFIRELDLPEPNVYLNASKGPEQFSSIIERSHIFLRNSRTDMVLVEGDTNSASAVAIAACKLRIPIGHIEAGCRSFDPLMQEEINRTLISDCAKFHFAATSRGVRNLQREGIPADHIYLTGHPVVRTIRRMTKPTKKSKFTDTNLQLDRFGMLTTHREENVDSREKLTGILNAISKVNVPILFPVHPRTRRMMKKFGLTKNIRKGNVTLLPPLSFVESLSLIRSSFVVFTDSGGIQQEAALLGTPCITLRDRTEWVETVDAGVNFLASRPEEIDSRFDHIVKYHSRIIKKFQYLRNIFGGNDATTKILEICKSCRTSWDSSRG